MFVCLLVCFVLDQVRSRLTVVTLVHPPKLCVSMEILYHAYVSSDGL